MLVRIWHTKIAHFVQCRVYVGTDPKRVMENVGMLRINVDKWDEFKTTMSHAEFVEDFAEAMYR